MRPRVSIVCGVGIDDICYLNALVQTNHSSDPGRSIKCSHLQAMREKMMRRESSKRAWHSRSSKQLRAGCPHARPRTSWQLSAPGVKKRAFPAMHLTHRGEVKPAVPAWPAGQMPRHRKFTRWRCFSLRYLSSLSAKMVTQAHHNQLNADDFASYPCEHESNEPN